MVYDPESVARPFDALGFARNHVTSSDAERSRPLLALAAFLALGLVFLLINLDLPIVRNSFVYAKTALNVIEHGFNPLPVVADRGLSHGKPVLFGLLAAPLVWLAGANAGVKVASFMGAAFFLGMTSLVLRRLARRAGVDPRFESWAFVFVALNPLLLYQFWSAYPNGLLGGEVLLAFLLTDVIATEPERDTRLHIVALGVVIYAAIHTNLYGMVLGLACPAYLLLHARPLLAGSSHLRAKVALLAVVFGALAFALILAKLELNPTLDFAAGVGGGGFSGYFKGLTDPSGGALRASVLLVVFTLVLNFHAALLLLLAPGARTSWARGPTIFGAVYVLALLPFSGTAYNMRFLLPLFPFLAVALAAGAQSLRPRPRRMILAVYAAVSVLLVVNYNSVSVYRRLEPLNEWLAQALPDGTRWLDNLRLGQHLALRSTVDRINTDVPTGGVLYWSSFYYGASTHGLAKYLGVREDIDVRYVFSSPQMPRPERTVHVVRYRTPLRLTNVREWSTVAFVGDGLIRLTPLRVELVGASRAYVTQGEPVRFRAEVVTGTQVRVTGVEFASNGTMVGVDRQPPFELTWSDPPAGRQEVVARATDENGNTAVSLPVVVYIGVRALETMVRGTLDDGEELPDGSMYLVSSDLELVEDLRRGVQLVGVRFQDIDVPRGAQIEEAHIQFTAHEISSRPTELVIQAELVGDAAPLDPEAGNLSNRPRTRSAVSWEPEPWAVVGERGPRQRTPNLAALLEELFAGPDWRDGNAIVLLIHGVGRRVARSFDSLLEGPPRLYIELR